MESPLAGARYAKARKRAIVVARKRGSHQRDPCRFMLWVQVDSSLRYARLGCPRIEGGPADRKRRPATCDVARQTRQERIAASSLFSERSGATARVGFPNRGAGLRAGNIREGAEIGHFDQCFTSAPGNRRRGTTCVSRGPVGAPPVSFALGLAHVAFPLTRLGSMGERRPSRSSREVPGWASETSKRRAGSRMPRARSPRRR